MAQSTDVANDEFDSTTLTGRLLADGVLFTQLEWNLGTDYLRNNFFFESDIAWFEFFGAGTQVIRRPYENLVIHGGGGINDFFFVAQDDPLTPGIQPPYEVSIRTLTLNDVSLTLEDATNFPVNLRFRSIIAGQSQRALVTLNDGTFDTAFRPVTADADMDLVFHSASGQNTLLNMGVDPVGRSLHFQVDPGTGLTLSVASPGVRYRSPSSLEVNAASLTLQGDVAALDLEMTSDGVNGLKVRNGSQLNLGGTGFSDRFSYRSNLPQDGIQIINSTLDLAPSTTLEGPLLLEGTQVTAGASARFLGAEMDVSGISSITGATGVQVRYDNLQGVAPGTLILDGGDHQFDRLFFLVETDLVLGSPNGARDTAVVAQASGGIPALLGRGLAGNGSFAVDNPVTGARFSSGSVLAPGHGIGQLNTRGRMTLESGASLVMEIDAARLAASAADANDLLVMAPAGAGQSPLFDVQPGASLSITLLNDTPLVTGTRVILVEYPDADGWSGQSLEGFPDGSTVLLGQNHWRVNYNDELVPGLPQRALTLTVVDPVAVVSPTHLDFATNTGTLSPLLTVTVENAGSANLEINDLQRFGNEFSISGESCIGIPLAPGASCQFTVRFFSSSPGTFTGAILVQSNSVGALPGLSMTGVATEPGAPEVSPDPSSLSFGPQAPGTLSPLQTVRIENTGNTDLLISNVQPTDAAFVVRNNRCVNLPVAPGASCAFDVGFLPATEGRISATVSIASNAGLPVRVAVTGEGREPLPPPVAVPVPASGRLALVLLVLLCLLGGWRRLA